MSPSGVLADTSPSPLADDDQWIAIIDGRLCRAPDATISIQDEGLLRGDGAFEVVRLISGRTFALADHLERLAKSAQALRLTYDADRLARELSELMRAAGPRDGALRIVITRGGRRLAMVEAAPQMPPSLALTTFEYDPIAVMRGVKSLSYAPNMLLRRLALAAGADDALLVSRTGAVLEAPTASFFYFWDAELCTPPLSSGILDSITRRHLLGVVGGSERPTTRVELAGIEEAFLASSLQEVHPIHRLDGRTLASAPGPRTEEIRRAMQQHVTHNLDQ